MKLLTILISSAFVALLSINASAQTKQTTAFPSPNEALKRQVRPWVIANDDTITRLITHSLIQTKVPGGVAFPLGVNENARVTLHSRGLTMQDLLDSIVRVEPSYKWEFVGGVVNLLPAEASPALLDAILPEFHQQKVTTKQMIDALERTPAVRVQATALGFSEEEYSLYIGPVSRETFSVECKKASVREILNEIVRVSGRSVWFYREYSRDGKKYFQLGLLFG